jgi:hypothetical protein
METIEREQDLLKRANARGLTMTKESSLAPRHTVKRPGIFVKRHMSMDQIEDFFAPPKENAQPRRKGGKES